MVQWHHTGVQKYTKIKTLRKTVKREQTPPAKEQATFPQASASPGSIAPSWAKAAAPHSSTSNRELNQPALINYMLPCSADFPGKQPPVHRGATA